MCGPDPRRPPHASSGALEAGLPPYEPSLNPSTTSSSALSSPSVTPTLSSTTPATSAAKKKRWYKPKLRVKLSTAWAWSGSLRAGYTLPPGRGESAAAKGVYQEWEQLPAYTPLAEGSRGRMARSDASQREQQDDWLIEPPSTGPGLLREDNVGEEPPPYR